MKFGTVYLVGAGPGDPKLLTIGGKEALAIADVVVYDRLVHPAQLKNVRPDCQLIYVGKQADRHTLAQDQINELLSEQAKLGKTVVRLKGGDPFVFGRGGEEAEHLRSLNIPFVIIPGITSAISAPAYAGIPVTHRDAASSFAVITGHERSDMSEAATRSSGEAEERRRWDRIAFAADTLIFLMGVESLSEITSRLIEHGRSPSTPVALVRWGTWAGRQETLVGEIGTIAATVARIGFKAPAVTVIGDVVKWRSRLQWWDNRPLFGKNIVVTRAREQSSGLVDLLTAEGAVPVEFPTIRMSDPSDNFESLDASLSSLSDYSWMVLTSVNAVDAVFNRLSALDKDSRALAGVKVAAIGPATADALRLKGITADFVPTQFTGEQIALEFPENPTGQKILIPRATDGAISLTDGLTKRGANVDLATAYETVLDLSIGPHVEQMLSEKQIDVVTFTSSNTVRNFHRSVVNGKHTSLDGVLIACIGPSTSQTAFELFGREPDIVAEQHTVPGLVDAIKAHFAAA